MPRLRSSEPLIFLPTKNLIFFKYHIDIGSISAIISLVAASVAHLVERHLAKVEVASSSLVTRSSKNPTQRGGIFLLLGVRP